MITIDRAILTALQQELTTLRNDRRLSDQAYTDMLANCRNMQAELDVLRSVLSTQDAQMTTLRAQIMKGKG
jgi:hypothetical protein